MPKLSFPPFYQLEEGDQLETGALRVSTLGFVAGAAMRVLVSVTMGLSSMTVTIQFFHCFYKCLLLSGVLASMDTFYLNDF